MAGVAGVAACSDRVCLPGLAKAGLAVSGKTSARAPAITIKVFDIVLEFLIIDPCARAG